MQILSAGQDQKSVKIINADHINSLVKPFKAGKILFNKEVSEWESDDDVMGHRLHAMAGFGCLGSGKSREDISSVSELVAMHASTS
jgi:hypothetical protein